MTKKESGLQARSVHHQSRLASGKNLLPPSSTTNLIHIIIH
jgi:hypothetical protein